MSLLIFVGTFLFRPESCATLCGTIILPIYIRCVMFAGLAIAATVRRWIYQRRPAHIRGEAAARNMQVASVFANTQ